MKTEFPSRSRVVRRLMSCLTVATPVVTMLMALALMVTRSFAPDIRVLPLDPIGTNAGWRVRWTNVPGATYQLQRVRGDRFPGGASTQWDPVATVTATSAVSSAEDRSAGPQVTQRFYRVVQLTNTSGDTIAPTVSFESARVVAGGNGIALRLTFNATDDAGVARVQVFEGTNVVGDASSPGGSAWVLDVTASMDPPVGRFFRATATDPAGNVGESATVGVVATDPDYFVPLDGNGQPREGLALSAVSTNEFGPFVFRPGGRPRPGYAPDFFLKFPDGATARVNGGTNAIEFVRVEAGFGVDSPIQLSAPLNRSAGPARQVPVGPLAFATLASVFGFNADEGLAITLFGQLPARWRGGHIDDRGLVGAEFQVLAPGFPLADWTLASPESLTDFSQQRQFSAALGGQTSGADRRAAKDGTPLRGSWTLPGGPTITIGPGAPLSFRFSDDDGLRLNGAVELSWPDGRTVLGQLRIEDSTLCALLSANELRGRSLTNLLDYLPANPAGCITGPPNDTTLSNATRCLTQFTEAYAHFAAAAAAAANDDASSAALTPADLNAEAASLEAWGFSAAAAPGQTLPLDGVAELASHFGQFAASGPSLHEIIAARLALLRVRVALQANTVVGSASARAQLEDALAEANAALVERARDFNGKANLSQMAASAGRLAASQSLWQQAGLAADADVTAAITRVFQKFGSRQAGQFGVSNGASSLLLNTNLNALNRFKALDTWRSVNAVLSHARTLGVEMNASTALDDLAGGLAELLLQRWTTALNGSELANDTSAFLLATREMAEVTTAARSGLLPSRPALAPLNDGTLLNATLPRLDALLMLELLRPVGDASLGRQAADLRALLDLVRATGSTAAFTVAPVRRLYDRMELKLAAAVTPLALSNLTVSNLTMLIEIEDAGAVHRELAGRFNIPLTSNWEGGRLPAVVQRFKDLAQPAGRWKEGDQLARALLAAATQAATVGDTPLRQAYLQQCGALLAAQREMARAELQRVKAKFVRPADFVLPGAFALESVAGYACFDWETKDFHGAVRGRLRLPQFGVELTVPNASLGSDGRFDLSAYGQMPMFPAGSTLAIPARQPLHFRYTPDEGMTFEGAGRLTLTNGLRFDAEVSLTESNYCFGLAAGNVSFALGKELVLRRPVLTAEALAGFSDSARGALNDYFRELSAGLDGVLGAVGAFPPVNETGFGRPPEFVAPSVNVDVAWVNAWANEVIAKARAGLNSANYATLRLVEEKIDLLNEQARIGVTAIQQERDELIRTAERQRAIRRMQEALRTLSERGLADPEDLAKVHAVITNYVNTEIEILNAGTTVDLPDRLADARDMVKLLLSHEAVRQGADLSAPPDPPSPSDPCLIFTNATFSAITRAQALASCALARKAQELGFDPATGNVADPAVLNALTVLEIDVAARVVIHIESAIEEVGTDRSVLFDRVVDTLLHRQREILLRAWSNTTDFSAQVTMQVRLLQNAGNLDLLTDDQASVGRATQLALDFEQTFGQASHEARDAALRESRETERLRNREIQSRVSRALGYDRRNQFIIPEDEYQPDLLTQLNHFFRVLGLPVPPEVATHLDSYVRYKVDELRARPFTVEFLVDRMNDAEGLLNSIVGLTDWADAHLAQDTALRNDLHLSLSNLTVTFTAAAEAQRAWWLLDQFQQTLQRHAETYGTNLSAVSKAALARSRDATLLAAGRVTDALATLFEQVQFEDVVLKLPGDVEVKNVFGRLCYGRADGKLTGCFGGRVNFPQLDTNAFFQITEACLDSDGGYHLNGSLASPLPVGRSRLQASLNVSGGSTGLVNFAGSGTLFVTNEVQGGERSFAVSLRYDATAQVLGFDAQGNNLALRLSDDFALFDAGFGFEFASGGAEGKFSVRGSAGMLAREHPLPVSFVRSNFHIVVDQAAVAFSYSTNVFSVALTNGTLRLPEFFEAGLCPEVPGQPHTGPQVSIVPGSPINVTIGTAPNPTASFSGGLDFRNLGLRVPGLTNLGVEICTARLVFRSNALPCLSNLTGTLSIPLPQQTALLDISDVEWCVDGFPTSASIELRNPLRLFDLDGVAFDFNAGSGFSFQHFTTNGAERTTFSMSGGITGTFDPNLLAQADNGGSFAFGTDGTFSWTTDEEPQFALGNLTFAAHLKIGGADGFELIGVDASGIPDTNVNSLASVTLSGLSNVFNLSPQRPFEVRLAGALGNSQFLYFGLGNARFIFDGAAPEPEFTVESLGFTPGEQLKLLNQQLLPFHLLGGSLTFLSPNQPLDRLFAPTNLLLTVSGDVDISLGKPDSGASSTPRLYGAVDHVQISLPNGYDGPPHFSVNTFTLQLEGLKIGDMAGISGGLTVGNLNDPANLYLAGLVGGDFNGVGIKAILATRLDGLLGLCLSVNAGPAGIPLDGGALGGILLTGAEGGVSFLNQFADPCDFKSYLGLGNTGTPPNPAASSNQKAQGQLAPSGPDVARLAVLKWDELQRLQKLHDAKRSLQKAGLVREPFQRAKSAAKEAGADVPCPTGDCPPATLNLLCQRHPSAGQKPSPENYNTNYAGRTIYKFSSLDRKTVDSVLAAANLDTNALNGNASVIASNFANAVTNLIGGLIPRPPDSLPQDQQQQINEFIDSSLGAARGLVATATEAALVAAAGTNRPPLEALYEAAYAGIKCVDLTIQLKGTFSYAPVSVALSARGGAVASTTGSAGVLGEVLLFGLPVGTGEFFYSLTDTNGQPNPSMCGQAHVALGPLEMGNLGLAIECQECVSGTLSALAQFVGDLSGQVLNDAAPIIYKFIEEAAGRRIPNVRSHSLNEFFGPPGPGVLLTQDEQVAVLTALLNVPKLALFLQQNPGAVSEFGNDAVAALSEQLIQLVLNIYNSANPRLQFCGEVEPKIFGISLTGGNTLVAARAYADKTNIRGDVTFSPSYVFGNMPFFLMSGGYVANVVPALDEATMGVSLGLPVVNNETLHLLTTNPVQFAAGQVDHLLANATVTFGYELSPFGFKLADGEGRLSLPTLFEHPDNPTRRNAHPEQYDQNGNFVPPAFPDRRTILKAALDTNVLAQATWAGKGADLSRLFPAGSAEAVAVADRELVRDYFPYGGFLGASKVQLPKPITDAPPLDQFARLFAPPTNIAEQFQVAVDLVNDYLLGSREVGHLMVYVPFPRPPRAFWTLGSDSEALIDSIARADLATLAQNLSLYPGEQLFMEGGLNAQFLGLSIGEGTLTADAAQGLFRLYAGVPQGSWLRSFFDASMTFEIKRADYIAQGLAMSGPGTNTAASPDGRIQAALDQLRAAAGGSAAQQQAAIENAVARITDTLPKASLDLSLNNLSIPDALTNVLRASAAAHFYAYSPRFEPGFAGTGPVAEARRNGGVAFKGRFNFASLVEIDNAELGVTLRGADLPALSGVFDVPELGLLHNAHFEFNSAPTNGGLFIGASGQLDSIRFINPLDNQLLLAIVNLDDPQSRLAADFRLRKTESGVPLPDFSISPARIDIPMLGEGLMLMIHGATTNSRFGFSSTAPWTNQVTVAGQISIHDPLVPSLEIARLGTPTNRFTAEIRGTGMELDLLAIDLPDEIAITAFPGTAFAYTITLGSGGADNRLRLARDGTFLIEGGIGGNLGLEGLGFGQINAGAAFQISNDGLRITIDGQLVGGVLSSLPNGSIGNLTGTFAINSSGVAISGMARLDPLLLGIFLLSGADDGAIDVTLANNGLSIPNGAKLSLINAPGYEEGDLLTLSAFVIEGDGDFDVAASNSAFKLPGYLSVTQGSFQFRRANGETTLQIESPNITFFPGTPQASSLSLPAQTLIVSDKGTFYANTGLRAVPLPAGFVAHGQLEIGYLADPRVSAISVSTNALTFGTIDYGQSVTRQLRVSNPGEGPLAATLSLQPAGGPFSITPSSIQLDGQQYQDVTVRFTPTAAGPVTNYSIRILHNAPTSALNVALAGTARAVPILSLSTTNINFGDVKLSNSAVRFVRVSNLGLTNLLVTNRIVSGPFTRSPSPLTIAPGSNAFVEVACVPTAVGNASGTLEFTANDASGARNVALRGTGILTRWYDQHDGPERLTALAMSGGNRGFVVGTPHAVLYTENRGHSWAVPQSLPTGDFSAAAITPDGLTGWIGKSAPSVYKTLDGGKTWQPVSDSSLQAAGSGYLGSAWGAAVEQAGRGRVLLAGSRWRWETNPPFGRQLVFQGIVATESPTGFTVSTIGTLPNAATWAVPGGIHTGVIAGNNRVYRTINDGDTWAQASVTPTPAGDIFGVALNSASVGLFVTSKGEIYRSTNGGQNWSPVTTNSGFVMNAVALDNTNACVAGGNGRILRSADSGLTWTEESAGSSTLYSVAARSNRVWVAGANGDIEHRPAALTTNGILTMEPAALDFGVVARGDSEPRVLWLRNRGAVPLVITNAVVYAPLASEVVLSAAFPTTIAPNDSLAVNVFYNPTSTNVLDGVIVLYSTDSDGPLSVPLRGRNLSEAWVLKSPLPNHGGREALDVQMVSATIGYALTDGAVFKTTNGGVTWLQLTFPNVGPPLCLHFLNDTTGWVGGGSSVGSFILRTSNGGASWTTQYSTNGAGVSDIHMVSSLVGYANTYLTIFTPARVLYTSNGGTNWVTRTRPGTTLGGHRLHPVSTTEIFLADDTVLYRSTDSGTNWTAVLTNTTGTLRDVFFADTTFGWVVGDNGTLWRTTLGGDTPAEWTKIAAFTTQHLSSIHFVSSSVGWATPLSSAGSAAIFATQDGGLTWREQLSESPWPGPSSVKSTVVFGRNTTNAVALGAAGSVRRLEALANASRGIPIVPPVVEAPSLMVGASATNTISVRNAGNRALTINSLLIEATTGANEFEVLTTTPLLVNTGQTAVIRIATRYFESGRVDGRLRIIYDGGPGGTNDTITVELSGEALAIPSVVTLQTEPPGLPLRLNGATISTPRAYTVVDATNNANEWRLGSVQQIEAPAIATAGGQNYEFVSWASGEERTFDFVATNGSVTFLARYVAVPSDQNGGPQGDAMPKAAKVVTVPPGLPTGPFLRVTQGTLSNSVLGGFSVSGSLLLSADNITASLRSRAVRIPADLLQPALAELTAGTWKFQLTPGSVALLASSPGLTVLSNTIAVPSELSFGFDRVKTNFAAQVSLPNGLPIVPGLAELGPNTDFSITYTSRFALVTHGEFRALRKPGNADWAVKQSLDLELRDGPFHIPIDLPASILRIPVPGTSEEFFEAHGGTEALSLDRNASGVLSVTLTNVGVDFLGRPVAMVSGVVNSSGLIALQSVSSSDVYEIGPFRWNASGRSSFEWNVRNGALKFSLPGGTLTAPNGAVPGWTGGLAFPPVSFDSAGDFDITISLEDFSFDNILLGQASNDEDRYARLKRKRGVLTMQLHDQQDFFDGYTLLDFTITGTGLSSSTVTGLAQANTKVNFGLFTHDFGTVTMTYNSARTDYQFRYSSGGFSLNFGTAGARACQRVCGPLGCDEFCVP